ncbi:hypothetical protein FKM82_013005 [Ascaphus truei]
MFSLILYIFVFLALTTTAHGSICYECINRTGGTCEEKPVSCKGVSQCFVMSEYTNMEGQEYHSIAKGCADEIPCGIKTYEDNGKILLHGHYKCCPGDNCNTDNYTLSIDNGDPRGKLCQACLIFNSSEGCISNETLQCKHKEDKCYSYIGTVRNLDGSETQYSETGCMSPSICDHDFNVVVGFEEIASTGIHCC